MRLALRLAILLTAAACGSAPDDPPPGLPTWVEPHTGMPFARLPPGTFEMGDRHEGSRRAVILTRAVWIGTREVTQAEWQAVLGERPAARAECPDCPVEQVNFADIERFLAELGRRTPEMRFRLPTEAEWEYACRAGTDGPYPQGAFLTTDAGNWHGRYPLPGQAPGEVRERTLPVGSLPANPWGLFDLNGNVWEWTADWYGELAAEPVTDPTGPAEGTHRVIRGGSYLFGADSARCGLRYTHEPQDLGPSLGFRAAAEER